MSPLPRTGYLPMAPRGRHTGPGLFWGLPQIGGYLLGRPHNKDYNLVGSILWSPYFGKLSSGKLWEAMGG